MGDSLVEEEAAAWGRGGTTLPLLEEAALCSYWESRRLLHLQLPALGSSLSTDQKVKER